MLARTHLLKIQRTLYDRLREYAHDYLGGLNPELKKYFFDYRREFRDFKAISNKTELLSALYNADLTFCGDYHTLSQAQRTVIRLLRDALPELKRQKREVILALEMVRPRDKAAIDSFLSGKLSEAKFLKSIGFKRYWGFDWANYRGLFQFAREHRIDIVGVNLTRSKKQKPPTLAARDRFASQFLCELTRSRPGALVVCLIGDLHLAAPHLPKQVRDRLTRSQLKRKLLVIHQNSERLYWKLAEKGLEQSVEVLKLKPNVFCVMNTPPWVKLQSYLKWHEVLTEMGRASSPESLSLDTATWGALSEIDRSQEIEDVLKVLCHFLEVRAPSDNFSDGDPSDTDLNEKLRHSGKFTPRELELTKRYRQEFKSYFFPRINLLFFRTLSNNQTAAQAAIYLHASLSGFKHVFQSPADLYPFLWVEALGFLGSKIINHKRKCNGPRELKRMIEQEKGRRSQKSNVEVSEFVLRHIQAENRYLKQGGRFGLSLPQLRPPSGNRYEISEILFYYKAAKLLGNMLGQALYSAAMSGKLDREELKALFEMGLDEITPREARAIYFEWLTRLDRFGYREFANRETL